MSIPFTEHNFYPYEPWYKRTWFRVRNFFRYLFFRPKFSAAALEPAEEILVSTVETEMNFFQIKEHAHTNPFLDLDGAQIDIDDDFTYEYLPEQPMRD